MQAPKDKHEAIDLFKRGRFGNKIATYGTVKDALKDNDDHYAIRYLGKPGVQGPAVFRIQRSALKFEWDRLIEAGWEENRLYVNGAFEDEFVCLQGELMLNHQDGWIFHGNDQPLQNMRQALKTPKTWKGLTARELLRSKLHPSSWEDLNLVIDEWPDAIIELVVTRTPCGDLAYTGRNMIIWEVRGY